MSLTAAAALLGFGLAISIIVLVSTKHGTIEIELNDPKAKVEVKVDGEKIHITGVGKPLTVSAGDHHLVITGEDFETISETFTVKHGANPALRVQLKPAGSRQQQRYLSDMDEFDVQVAEGPPEVPRFAKKGNLGFGEGDAAYSFGRITVSRKESPNGLSMCPNSNTYARARYRLDKKAQTFVASVALNDSAGSPGRLGSGRIPTPLTFQILGDGKFLWSSKPVDIARNTQECKVDVTGVNVLELRVDCPGSNINAQAVWVEPHVLLK